MKLTFLYQPVKDLKESVAFYRDTLGFDESWREGESTAAFKLPGSEVELMLDVPPDTGPRWGAGGFYAVDSVDSSVASCCWSCCPLIKAVRTRPWISCCRSPAG